MRLRLPLDKDLTCILKFYGVPLCKHASGGISCVTGFLSLICFGRIPCSLNLFCCFFSLQIMKLDGFVRVGIHSSKKLIRAAPCKYGCCGKRFFFVEVLEEFPPCATWRDLNEGHVTPPSLSAKKRLRLIS